MEAGVDQSLRRMKTDHLDVLQFHGTPAKSVLEEHDAIETLQRLRDKGKIRFIASSSSIPNIRDHIEMGVFDSFQIPYSALSRSHEGVIAQSAESGIGTVIRGGVAKGEPGVSGVTREEAWTTFYDASLEDLLEEGESKTAFILRFTLAHPDMHTTIVGTQNIDHMEENVRVAAMNGPFPTTCTQRPSGVSTAWAKRRRTDMGKARMGVIGAGWWATQFHIPSLKTYENAELVGIADLKEDKLAKAADYYDIANQYTDHRELLASGVDGVVVAVQHAYHYQVARDALDAGVSVMIEKPMTLRADEAWDLVEQAEKNGFT